MPTEMRELQGDDLWTVIGIIGKLDIEQSIVDLFGTDENETTAKDHLKTLPTKAQQAKDELALEQRGKKVMATLLTKILTNITAIKPDVNTLLAELTGTTAKEVGSLSLSDYTSLIIAFTKKPELKDFFSSIASLLQ